MLDFFYIFEMKIYTHIETALLKNVLYRILGLFFILTKNNFEIKGCSIGKTDSSSEANVEGDWTDDCFKKFAL